MTPRRIFLALALLVTLLATFWPQPQDDGVVSVAARDKRVESRVATRSTSAKVEVPRLSTLPPPRLGLMQADLFPAQSWRPPPPPPPPAPIFVPSPPPPPPPPVAPPLPFQYLGRWQEAGKEVVFLSQSNNVMKAQVGEVIAGWRLEQVNPGTLTFTWTALNMQQLLRIAP